MGMLDEQFSIRFPAAELERDTHGGIRTTVKETVSAAFHGG
jgi:hypothetical protein